MQNCSGCGCRDRVICVYQGDAYLAIDKRAMCFESKGCAWPDGLVSCQLILDPVAGGCGCPFVAAISIAGTITPAEAEVDGDTDPGPWRACFDLTAKQTSAMTLGHHAYRYRVIAMTATGSRVTLDSGRMSVR